MTSGNFSVVLDFGAGVWNGAARWLETSVRPHGSSADFIPLAPRQEITSEPYAIRAREAGALSGPVSASQIAGTIPANAIAPGTITSSMLAAGSVKTTNVADGAVSLPKLLAEIAPSPDFKVLFGSPSDNGIALAALGADRFVAASMNTAALYARPGTRLAVFTNQTVSVSTLGERTILLGGGNNVSLLNTNGAATGTLTGPSNDAQFGASVAGLGADRVIVGAPATKKGGQTVGAVYLYSSRGTLLLALTNPAPLFKGFGSRVAAVRGDRILVGGDSMYAYLYATNGALLATFRGPGSGESFGSSIATAGADKILIGAKSKHAYLYNTKGVLLTTFTNPNPANASFGSAAAFVAPDVVVIGAGETTGTGNIGAVYVFNLSGSLLATITNPAPNIEVSLGREFVRNDGFGGSIVAFGPGEVLVSAPNNDFPFSNRGAVHAIRLDRFIPQLVGDGAREGSITTGSLATGAVTAEKISPTVGVWTASSSNVFRTAGKVGIGTTNPAGALHIRSSPNADIVLENPAGHEWVLRSTGAGGAVGALQILDRTAGDRIGLAISPLGQVGIATTNPTAPLFVNGAIGWGRSPLQTNQGGSIKLGQYTTAIKTIIPGATPYIDFLYGVTNRLQDYNVRLINDADGRLTVVGNLAVTGAISQSSDRNVKKDFTPVSSSEILEKVAKLPIQTWVYTSDAEVRHVGPTAQDFKDSFGVGADEKHIATVDADGIALLSIQALHQKLIEKQQQIDTLAERVNNLEKLLNDRFPSPNAEPRRR